jgi:AmmeMemoRadiSam system protein B
MKQSVINFSGKKIQEELEKAGSNHSGKNDSIRILFAPSLIDQENISQAASVYSRLNPEAYDTVVVVEELKDILGKKLPMPSNKKHKTSLGEVPVDDYLRNEFCDEDDDFFIEDSGFHPDLSLFQQLMMLQKSLKNFKVLNLQIADEDKYIIKELVSTIDELLSSRRALLVFCCDLTETGLNDFKKIKSLLKTQSHADLFNLLNSSPARIKGTAAFIAGILIAKRWALQIQFPDDLQGCPCLAAYAEREHVLY